jgi:hypothetical protein
MARGEEPVTTLTAAEKADARLMFEAGAACESCGGLHKRACPRVKRIERHPNGNITGVTYFKSWDDSSVIFPEDAYDPEQQDTEAAGG